MHKKLKVLNELNEALDPFIGQASMLVTSGSISQKWRLAERGRDDLLSRSAGTAEGLGGVYLFVCPHHKG